MVYFHNFIIPYGATITLKRLTMTSYYKVKRICYSVYALGYQSTINEDGFKHWWLKQCLKQTTYSWGNVDVWKGYELRSLSNWVLRRIFGPKKTQEEDEYNCVMGWFLIWIRGARHVAHMEERCDMYTEFLSEIAIGRGHFGDLVIDGR